MSTLRDAFPDLFRFIDAEECGLTYSARLREFGLRVRPDSQVVQVLSHCPFSGARLPASLRDQFFDELEALGFHDGLADVENAPAEFQSEAWWTARNL